MKFPPRPEGSRCPLRRMSQRSESANLGCPADSAATAPPKSDNIPATGTTWICRPIEYGRIGLAVKSSACPLQKKIHSYVVRHSSRGTRNGSIVRKIFSGMHVDSSEAPMVLKGPFLMRRPVSPPRGNPAKPRRPSRRSTVQNARVKPRPAVHSYLW
ncbi:hypothetical protein GQ53DRAFT_111121 [Thozetella sp. PMI_491]|nr:hypothetical protein GQ53DRAFT_111121 [Thozetella sp. PMI_491]